MGSDSGDGGHGDLYGTGSFLPNETAHPDPPVNTQTVCLRLGINHARLRELVDDGKLRPVNMEKFPWEFTIEELGRYEISVIDDQYDLVSAPHPTDGEESADTVVDEGSAVTPVSMNELARELCDRDYVEPPAPLTKRALMIGVAAVYVSVAGILVYGAYHGWFS